MKILVTGASGLLGASLMNLLSKFNHEVFGTYNKNSSENLIFLDISNEKMVESVFAKIKPEAVIHAASIVNIETCEKDHLLAEKVNVQGTKNIANACLKFKSKMYYLSSDYVFDGERGPYNESSKTEPVNFYGQTKVEAENAVLKSLKDSLIVRPTTLYGFSYGDAKSFVQKTLSSLSKGEKIFPDRSLTKYPLMTDDLSAAILFLLEKNKSGIYHITGQQETTYYRWALEIAGLYKLSKDLINPGVSRGEAPRPRHVLLNDSKLKALGFKYKFKTLAEGIKAIQRF